MVTPRTPTLPPELHKRCRAALLICSQFEEESSLRHAINWLPGLTELTQSLPQGRSPKDRVYKCINHFLPHKIRKTGKWALVMVLEQLREGYEGTTLYDEFSQLIVLINQALESTSSDSVEADFLPEQLQGGQQTTKVGTGDPALQFLEVVTPDQGRINSPPDPGTPRLKRAPHPLWGRLAIAVSSGVIVMLAIGAVVFTRNSPSTSVEPPYVDHPSSCSFKGVARAIRLNGKGMAAVSREFVFSEPIAESVELKGGYLVKGLGIGNTVKMTATSIVVKSPEQLLPAYADARDYYVEYAFYPERTVEFKLKREAGDAQGILRGGTVSLDQQPLVPQPQELRIDWAGMTPLVVVARLNQGWKGPVPVAGPLEEVTGGILENARGELECTQGAGKVLGTVSGRVSWAPTLACDLGPDGQSSRRIESIRLDAEGFHLEMTGCMRVER